MLYRESESRSGEGAGRAFSLLYQKPESRSGKGITEVIRTRGGIRITIEMEEIGETTW